MTVTETYKRLTGAHIKWIAIVLMLIDHIGAVLLEPILLGTEGISAGAAEMQLIYYVYIVLRGLGRFSFPAFCFLLAEGFYHTRSKLKYLRNMAIFMLLSEVPFDLGIGGRAWDFAQQNVFFTLAMGFAAIWIADWLNRKAFTDSNRVLLYRILSVAAVLLIAYGAELLNTDYGAVGVAVIYILYAMHTTPVMSAVFAWIILSLTNWLEIFCFPFVFAVMCYNGKRGRQPKYFFYIFYPVHLLLLVMIRTVMF